jgi:hypothetical protein
VCGATDCGKTDAHFGLKIYSFGIVFSFQSNIIVNNFSFDFYSD